MKEFDYELPYKELDFTDAETRKLYRIGRGEQGVLLVRPYTNDICAHWRFVDEEAATKSSNKIYEMFCEYKRRDDFIEWTWQGNSLEMDSLVPDGMPITLRDGKYAEDGSVSTCEKDCLTNVKAKAAQILK